MDEQAPNLQPADQPSGGAKDATVMESVPSQWPGAFGLYKYSKAAVMVNVWTLVALMVGTIVISMLLSSFDRPAKGEAPSMAYLLAQIISFFVSAWFSAATALAGIASVKRQKIDVAEALQHAGQFLLPFIGLSIVTAIIGLASFLLLVIPFFFVLPRLVLAPYYLLDQKMGVSDSIQASWDRSKGHVGKIYGVIGATLAMALVMLTIVGIPIAIYLLVMYSFAEVILYYYIKEQTIPAVQQTPDSNVGATPPTSI